MSVAAHHQTLRAALLLASIGGAVFFGAALLVSYVQPLLVEKAAREIVRTEVERRVGDKIEVLSNSKVVDLAQKALGKTEDEIVAARRAIADDVPRRVAEVVADMLNADCECRKRLVERAVKAQEEQLSSLGQIRQRLVGLIESSYASVTHNLMREFRIFSAANAAAFALLGLVTCFRRAAALQLMLPAVVLLGAAVITGALYLFNQNWLHTIIYSDYVGMAYFAYLAAVALALADVIFNKARVTTWLLNRAFDTVGSAAVATPC
jgi:ABC-type multidrug transport system fused ATPase/permease subunit